MIEIFKYTVEDKIIWDDFLDNSKIDTFLFKRDFMDYHNDRFNDSSFLIYKKEKLCAILPGNIDSNTFYSHQGLTYGGLISSYKLTLNDTLEIFNLINLVLKTQGIENVIYKPMPYIYKKYPSEEDIYALFKLGANKISCNISSTIYQKNKISFIESRKSGIRKAKKGGVKVLESVDYFDFWTILTSNMWDKHGLKPVHNYSEIDSLISKFPNNIKLYAAYIDNMLLGGSILFIMDSIIHVQYIASTIEGRKHGALDLIFDELINNVYVNYPIFDFGISTEKNGHYLNEELLFQKEGFGGRGVLYDAYKYDI